MNRQLAHNDQNEEGPCGPSLRFPIAKLFRITALTDLAPFALAHFRATCVIRLRFGSQPKPAPGYLPEV